MKSDVKHNVIIVAISLIFSISCFVLVNYFAIWRFPSAEAVFDNSQHSVVELKCSKDDLVTYGSAVMVKDDGTMISNAHMVTYKYSGAYEEYDSFEVRFCFEEGYRKASLVKYDLNQDLSILRLDDTKGANFAQIKMNNNDDLKAGSKVYAVGNGMNHGLGITQGIVSVSRVNILYEETMREVIQCDLVINEGNSGGALLDENGKLIGITTFRLKDNNGNVIYGTAYSIPIRYAVNYCDS